VVDSVHGVFASVLARPREPADYNHREHGGAPAAPQPTFLLGWTLVLSHFVPPDDPKMTEAMWRDAASRHFRGAVIVGRDLLEI
jgi:hypothetical protein